MIAQLERPFGNGKAVTVCECGGTFDRRTRGDDHELLATPASDLIIVASYRRQPLRQLLEYPIPARDTLRCR